MEKTPPPQEECGVMGFYNGLDSESWACLNKPTCALAEKDPLTQRDIYEDPLVLKYLQTGILQDDLGAKERDRVLQRAKRF